ncbi:hypothetical protein QCD85_09955 [Paenibacillus sp. PsM32]|uniref:hypothetical protein n=1 Tax=unclassified Paenibacillus TaxID=185978 RepID=UPI002367301C|nr:MULTISPECIES: hypothetical protein [unclassified Paenibacillus]MDN4618421.1 hypothetical protein [Paenibacillus sp. PsM32]WDF52944.1 hypothetical protein PQ460_11170 [Paenibacillus sp. KACC 21273]
MVELQTLLLSKVLPGGILSLIIGILFFVGRSRFLTMFTSTKIEKLVYSKEKNFFIKATKTTFVVILISATLFYCSVLLMILKLKYMLIIITIVVLAILLIGAIFYAIIYFKQGLKKYFEEADRKIASLFLLLYNLFSFSLIPLIAGSLFTLNEEDVKQIIDINKLIELRFLIILIILLFIFIGALCLRLFENTLILITKEIRVEKLLFIKFGNGTEVTKWYIFHLNENNQFLLGDNPIQDKCMVYKFIEKEELIKKEIYVHQDEDPSLPIA